MIKQQSFSVKIDLEFTDVRDAIKVLSQINTFSIKQQELKKQVNTAKLTLKRVIKPTFIEPNIEEINGKKCLVYKSQMNET